MSRQSFKSMRYVLRIRLVRCPLAKFRSRPQVTCSLLMCTKRFFLIARLPTYSPQFSLPFSSANSKIKMVLNILLLLLFLTKFSSSKSDNALLSILSEEDRYCSSDDGDEDCDATVTVDCDAIFEAKGAPNVAHVVRLKQVLLDDVNVEWKDREKMFFVESAGNDHLKTRQVATSRSVFTKESTVYT